MMNSFKRKKAVEASKNTKTTNKRPKPISKPTKQALPELVPLPRSLDHLVDRPYVEYESHHDDISTTFFRCINSSLPDSGLRRCFQRQDGPERRPCAPCQRRSIAAGSVTRLHRQGRIRRLSPPRPVSLCTPLFFPTNSALLSYWRLFRREARYRAVARGNQETSQNRRSNSQD